MSLTVLIAGVDRTALTDFGAAQQVTFTLPTRGQRGTCAFRINRVASNYIPEVGEPVKIYDNGNIRWTGSIDNVVAKSIMTADATQVFYTVSGVSEEQRLDKRMFTGNYDTGMLAGDVVTDLIGTQFADEGITLGTIQPGGTLTAPITPTNRRVSDLLTQLAGLSGSATFTWSIFDGVLTFAAIDAVAAPFDVDDDKMVITPSIPQNKLDRSTYRNVQHVQINTANLSPSTQSFTGDDVTDSFTLQLPIGVILSITLGGGVSKQAATVGTFIGIPADGATFTWGPNQGQTYTFRDTPVSIYDVQIGGTPDECASNLADVINGTLEWLSMADVFTGTVNGPAITFTARMPGSFVPTITVTGDDGGSPPGPFFTFQSAGTLITGTFGTNPTDGDFVQITLQQGPSGVGPVYTFRNSPSSLLDVQIGASATESVANLVAALNGTVNAATAAVGLVTASAVGPILTMSLQGPGVVVTVSSSAWALGTSSGPGADGSAIVQTFAEVTAAGGSDPIWVYTAGGLVVSQTANQTPPPAGAILTIVYQPIGFGNITVTNPAEIAARQAIEGGSGIYENAINRPDLLTIAAGLQVAQSLLDSYDSIAQTVTFWTYNDGLLPGQLLYLISERLDLNAHFLIQQVQGLFEKTNDPGNHFRYQITCVSQTLQQSAISIFVKTAPQTLGNTSAGAQTPASTAASAGNGFEVTFGLNDDTPGVNAAQKYAPTTDNASFIGGLLTVVTLPTAAVVIDIKASIDKGQTWASIFQPGKEITIPPIGTVAGDPNVYSIGGFIKANYAVGALLRCDVITGSNGAAGIVIWLKGGVAGTSGFQASGQIPGNGIMFAGDGVI